MPSWSERALDFPLLSLPRRGNQLGVVGNTPVIVKYPFWQMTLANAKAVYACLNYGEAFARARLQTGVSALTGTSATYLRLCPCHYCEPSVPEAECDGGFDAGLDAGLANVNVDVNVNARCRAICAEDGGVESYSEVL